MLMRCWFLLLIITCLTYTCNGFQKHCGLGEVNMAYDEEYADIALQLELQLTNHWRAALPQEYETN